MDECQENNRKFKDREFAPRNISLRECSLKNWLIWLKRFRDYFYNLLLIQNLVYGESIIYLKDIF